MRCRTPSSTCRRAGRRAFRAGFGRRHRRRTVRADADGGGRLRLSLVAASSASTLPRVFRATTAAAAPNSQRLAAPGSQRVAAIATAPVHAQPIAHLVGLDGDRPSRNAGLRPRPRIRARHRRDREHPGRAVRPVRLAKEVAARERLAGRGRSPPAATARSARRRRPCRRPASTPSGNASSPAGRSGAPCLRARRETAILLGVPRVVTGRGEAGR